MKAIYVLYLFFGLSLMSCSPRLTPFSDNLYKQNNWTDDELKSIQFYTSRDIVLHRQIKDRSAEIITGKIKIENGKEIEEIIIREGTPGIFLFKPKDDKKRFAISFEDGGENRFLVFGPSKRRGGEYALQGNSKWKNHRAKVFYDGRTFFATNSSGLARLLVDLKRIGHTKRNSRIAKGRKIE